MVLIGLAFAGVGAIIARLDKLIAIKEDRSERD
jgi:hypothetical protein